MNHVITVFALLVGAFFGVLVMSLAAFNARDEEREELARLRGFAQDILQDWPEIGDLDGFELQEAAHKHGLLIAETRYKPCREEGCMCAAMVWREEWDEGVTCYRKSSTLMRASA